jgi:Phage-related protein
MTLTFTPAIPPQGGPSGSVKFSMVEIRFGDGYISSMGNGLNTKSQIWPLTWVGTESEIDAIRDFFDLHEGYKRFLWTPPMGVQGYYCVKEYTLIPEAAGNASINVTLEQRFAP